jgi:hypothetical protein
MTDFSDRTRLIPEKDLAWIKPGPAFLIYLHIVICCVSLIYVSDYYLSFHIYFEQGRLYQAALAVSLVALITPLFTFARFSFGYFAGFYLYTIIFGYVWLNCFSEFHYDHDVAGLSACVSIVAFLLPALLVTSPFEQRYVIPPRAFEHLLTAILVLAGLTVAIGATYNFRAVGITRIYEFRSELEFPKLLSYLIGITSTALLPFAYACFAIRGDRWRCAVALVLLIFFYPITLSKFALFTPAWLVTIALLSKFLEARTTVVLSLFLPILAGLVLLALSGSSSAFYLFFSTVNFRMIAIPSLAIDIYNDFFSRHDLTYFCQISFLSSTMNCPYDDPLSVLMQKTYELGNFNASLFATEGIASIGMFFAPISALFGGFVVAFGNRASANLPTRFVLISSAIVPQILLNVPLSTALLTNGVALLFLLWYVMPRAFFEPLDRR